MALHDYCSSQRTHSKRSDTGIEAWKTAGSCIARQSPLDAERDRNCDDGMLAIVERPQYPLVLKVPNTGWRRILPAISRPSTGRLGDRLLSTSPSLCRFHMAGSTDLEVAVCRPMHGRPQRH